MNTRPVHKADYDHIVCVIDHWWEGPTSALAHPIFFYELGQLSRIVEEDNLMIGFLFGFLSESFAASDGSLISDGQRTGYVHLIGIHPDHRRRGVARVLYGAFEKAALEAGCTHLKAITTQGNEGSVRFHQALGWSASEVDSYAGPGRTRVIFEKALLRKEC